MLLFTHQGMSNSLWPHKLQHTKFLSFIVSQSLLKLMSIESVMPSNHLILCCPLFLLPSVFPRIRVFSNELVFCISWPKCRSFSFSISPSNECSGLISFGTDWFDLFAVQGTLKSLFQYHSSKASILWHSVFFVVQLSHLYMSTGQTIALTIRIFVCQVMSLLLKKYVKAVYCHPVYLTYMQSTSCEILGWMTRKLESRLLGEISTTSNM